MMKCKEVVLKISSGHEDASWKERVGVRFHLMMCGHCRRYSKHLEILGASVKSMLTRKEVEISSDQLKTAEDKALENAMTEREK